MVAAISKNLRMPEGLSPAMRRAMYCSRMGLLYYSC
jgi:hypothetical protein